MKPDGKGRAWFAFAMALTLFAGYAGNCLGTLLHGPDPHRLIGTFWASGWAAAHGLNPYAGYALTWHSLLHLPHDRSFVFYDVNLGPPLTVVLFQYLSAVSLNTLCIGWTVVSVLLTGVGVFLLALRNVLTPLQVLYLFFSVCPIDTVHAGHYYALVFFLCCLACLLPQESIQAAVLIGLIVALKPNLAFWPLLLLLAGRKKIAAMSLSVAFALSLVPLTLYGREIYWQWFAANNAPHYIFPWDISIIGIFSRFGHRSVGYAVAMICIAMLLLYVWQRRPEPQAIAALAIGVGIFMSPIGWVHYSYFAAPFFVTAQWGRMARTAAVLLCIPILPEMLAVGQSGFVALLAGLPHLVGAALMFYSASMGRALSGLTPECRERLAGVK